MPSCPRDERLNGLAHDLRNQLNTAILAVSALKGGRVGFDGATATALGRSLAAMRVVTDRVLNELRIDGAGPPAAEVIDIATCIVDIQVDAALLAAGRPWGLAVPQVETGLLVAVDRRLLMSTLTAVVRDAIELTPRDADVVLRAFASDARVLVELEDQCGTLPEETPERASLSFGQSGGKLYVRRLSPRGCVFTLDLPRVRAPETQAQVQVATGLEVSRR